ncbi:CASP-like protein 1, partial [Tanacetum coccineum]
METTMKWSESLKDGVKNHGVVDATLRAVLFATTNVALIAMVTSKETKMIPISPTMKVPLDASFNQSPAYMTLVDTEKKLGPEGSPVTDPTLYRSLVEHFSTSSLPDPICHMRFNSYVFTCMILKSHALMIMKRVLYKVAACQVSSSFMCPSRFQYADIYHKSLPKLRCYADFEIQKFFYEADTMVSALTSLAYHHCLRSSSISTQEERMKHHEAAVLSRDTDSLCFGIVASATGAAAAVGYIGIKGNFHSRWNKFCNIYHSFCHQMEVSVFMSLISTLALLLL